MSGAVGGFLVFMSIILAMMSRLSAGPRVGSLARTLTALRGVAVEGAKGRPRTEDRLAIALARAGIQMPAARWRLMVGLLVGLLGAIMAGMSGSLWFFLPGGALGYVAPSIYLATRREKRAEEFDAKLEQALRFGYSLLQSHGNLPAMIEGIAEEADPPIRDVFRDALVAMRSGLPPDMALRKAADTVDSRDFPLIVNGLEIHYKTGGNPKPVFESVLAILRARREVNRVVQVETATARASFRTLVSVLMLVVLGMFVLVRPLFARLLDSGAGQLVVAVCLTMVVAGVVLLRRVTTVRI